MGFHIRQGLTFIMYHVSSDFLTNSYNKGGLISVMALSGLFLLITEYGLEYPEFYNKLYALLEPSMFIAKYRARFFEVQHFFLVFFFFHLFKDLLLKIKFCLQLLDLSLKSPLLPSYLAAAFAKKLGRMALKSPPAGALIVIAIVHNLLRRHPSINCLVHQVTLLLDIIDAEIWIYLSCSAYGSSYVRQWYIPALCAEIW